MRRYAKRSWRRPEGYPEDTALCIAEVMDSWSNNFNQCARKRGHGPDGLYCRQHGKMLADGKHVSVPEDK